MTWTSFRVPTPGSYNIALCIANTYLPRRQPRHLPAKQSFHCSLCEVKQRQKEQRATCFSWGRGEKNGQISGANKVVLQERRKLCHAEVDHVCRERPHDKPLLNLHTQTHYKCLFSSCSTLGAAACCIVFDIDSNVVCHVKPISGPASYCKDCAEVYVSTKTNIKSALILGQQRNKKGRNSTTCTVNFKVYSACS